LDGETSRVAEADRLRDTEVVRILSRVVDSVVVRVLKFVALFAFVDVPFWLSSHCFAPLLSTS
jgi:hypothetical protein